MAKSVKTNIPRGLTVVSFMTAAIVMFVSKQEVDDEQNNITFILRYTDWSGFRFCHVVDWVAFLYNFLVLLIPDQHKLWKTVVYTDVIMNILVGTSLGVGWQIYILIIRGNIIASWAPICGLTRLFFSKILGSLITSSLGFVVNFGLLMGTIHVVMTDVE